MEETCKAGIYMRVRTRQEAPVSVSRAQNARLTLDGERTDVQVLTAQARGWLPENIDCTERVTATIGRQNIYASKLGTPQECVSTL